MGKGFDMVDLRRRAGALPTDGFLGEDDTPGSYPFVVIAALGSATLYVPPPCTHELEDITFTFVDSDDTTVIS